MFRLSLRELLALVGLLALAIVSLKDASYFKLGLVGMLAFAMFAAAAIAAIVDRGRRRAFAIGTLVAMSLYGLLMTYADFADGSNDENYGALVTPGRLATTSLLDTVYQSVVTYHDVVENGAVVRQYEVPYRHTFMMTGHAWWMLVIGYVGGRFARYSYLRRSNELET